MAANIDFGGQLPFRIMRPHNQTVPFFFNSPHSGRQYPASFLQMSRLNDFDIRLSEDRYVDLIFGSVPQFGAPLMLADFPRAYLDVNREPFELDHQMFEEALPNFVPKPSPRVLAGLGSVPKIVAQGKNIYAGRISAKAALNRIEHIYQPYHTCLDFELQQIKAQFGYAVLIDCHSMPGQLKFFQGTRQPDFVLGDVYGRSCASQLSRLAAQLLSEMGYYVQCNQPYAGGFITMNYGRPLHMFHALQIEINRDLYLDPETLEPDSGFDALKKNMSFFVEQLVQLSHSAFILQQDAAE
ncbi:N-formylglutamate amidohydrolase [Bartonella sp. HY038]|uniref:N-formylglutamate amidohydrolase n=1 Tax=Bartonella sp. HY038 TaxID=2759660 RepID=UPI001FF05FE2|nr:N-formylglutamate amidohydrolase [Bartonella sp. HY038]